LDHVTSEGRKSIACYAYGLMQISFGHDQNSVGATKADFTGHGYERHFGLLKNCRRMLQRS
jgi:hypothetical protein